MEEEVKLDEEVVVEATPEVVEEEVSEEAVA